MPRRLAKRCKPQTSLRALRRTRPPLYRGTTQGLLTCQRTDDNSIPQDSCFVFLVCLYSFVRFSLLERVEGNLPPPLPLLLVAIQFMPTTSRHINHASCFMLHASLPGTRWHLVSNPSPIPTSTRLRTRTGCSGPRCRGWTNTLPSSCTNLALGTRRRTTSRCVLASGCATPLHGQS